MAGEPDGLVITNEDAFYGIDLPAAENFEGVVCAWCERENGNEMTGTHGICAAHYLQVMAPIQTRRNKRR